MKMKEIVEVQIPTSETQIRLEVEQDLVSFHKLFQKLTKQVTCLAALMSSSKNG